MTKRITKRPTGRAIKHTIGRTGFCAVTALFFFLVISFTVDLPAGAAKPRGQWGVLAAGIPNNIGNTFTGDPASARTITWESSIGTGEVIIGNDHYPSTVSSVGSWYFHRVDVSGLQAGQTYSYVAGSPGFYSPVYNFKTEDFTAGDFTIIHVTDPQIGSGSNAADAAVWKRVIESAVNLCPQAAFAVNTGDIVENAREANIPFYFDYSQDTIAQLPFIYTMGNNDSALWYNRYFYTPANGSGGFLYSFDYGNTHFVSIDSNIKLTAAQLGWLENDLGTTAQKWKVAMTHEGDYGRSGRNTALTKLFDKYNVDLVLMGHNHFYARSRPINAAGMDKAGGTVWSIPNTAGTKFNAKAGKSYLARDEQPNLPMFSTVKFSSANIELNSYTVDKNGAAVLFDTYSFR